MLCSSKLLLFSIKSNKSDMTVVAFLIFPTKTNNFNVDSLKGQAIANQLREAVDDIQRKTICGCIEV